ncbi:hypothetical protein CLHUN_34470 [Ruminiclostridium hungatei]|uniref:Uncharacterized protein n=1 Tax=Ruminiclostridium hungatei TaxID=48256 RepID=A0A1V4SGJ8_RUMHU|nr:hypothetical protein [Ruminiclostridium hungatei]OPX42626.1 hypothetical protein CLHUN_34470 [Ruminiclostridium hungatei]
MLQVELVQMLHMLVFLFVVFMLTISFVHSFRPVSSFLGHADAKCRISTIVLYFRELSVVDYNCYHKFEIWRKYRFS